MTFVHFFKPARRVAFMSSNADGNVMVYLNLGQSASPPLDLIRAFCFTSVRLVLRQRIDV
jgi:hypothetical protein